MIEKPLSMQFGDWDLAVLEGTWIHTGESTHAAAGELVASEALSGLLGTQLDKIFDHLPGEIRPAVVAEVKGLWFRDGRLVAEIVSEGDLSDPDVKVLNKYPELVEIVKEAGEKFAREQLKDLGERLLDRLLGEED